MAKNAFTTHERAIWNSIYGVSRGPSSGRLKILVESFEELKLIPAMMRIDDEMLPYNREQFRDAMRVAFDTKEDDRVQVYYHPAECELVVGSSATTWVRWGRAILECEGLVAIGAVDSPILVENVPRVALPVCVREALLVRGVNPASICTLVSARMVAFFIAAQYGAWGTTTEVLQVTPFKNVLRKLDFIVRDCDARRGSLFGDILQGFDVPVNTPITSVEVTSPEDAETPPSDFEVTSFDVGVDEALTAIDLGGAPIPPTERNQVDELLDQLVAEEARDSTLPDLDAEEEAIRAELRAAEQKLYDLQQKRRAAQIERTRQMYLASRVTDAIFDTEGNCKLIFLRLPGGEVLRIPC